MSGAARWIVKPGDGERVDDVLPKLGSEALCAAAEGRAFVNGRRAGPDAAVTPGDEITVWSRRDAQATTSGADHERAQIIARWGDIVAAYKPPSLPTTPDRRGARSLVLEVKELLNQSARGSPRGAPTSGDLPHAASRLDVGVSGVVLCAIGRPGLQHLEAVRAKGLLHKRYIAIAGGPLDGAGKWDAPIGRVRASSSSDRWKPAVLGRDAVPAITRYRVLSRAGFRSGSSEPRVRATLLLAQPVTGRMHQIRVHAANAGAPLFGDREHGGPRTIVDRAGRVIAVSRIALHALSVELPGERGDTLRAASPPPDDFRLLWSALDGPDVPWNDLAGDHVSVEIDE